MALVENVGESLGIQIMIARGEIFMGKQLFIIIIHDGFTGC